MTRFRISPKNTSLPLLVLLLSSTSIVPAYAGCNPSETTETCTGTVTGAIVHRDGTVLKLEVYNLSGSLNAQTDTRTEYQNGAAIDLRDPGGVTPEPSDWNNGNRNGQSGIDGAAGKNIEATVDLSPGQGIKGPSGVFLSSQGWTGSGGHGADHTDKTAYGGVGGRGGDGGDVSFVATHRGSPGIPAPISVGSSEEDSFGIELRTFGGNGGTGGTGHSKGGLKDGHGGNGGDGGDAGEATLTLDTGHTLVYNGGGIGLVMTADGGDGGEGGKGEVDAIDADSAYGGGGGTGGDGGVITATANFGLNSITTTGSYGVVLSSSGGDGGKGGEGEGGHVYPGAGGDAGDGGQITADLRGAVSTSGSEGAAIYVSSAGGFAGESGDGKGGIKDHPAKPGEPGEGGTVSLTLTESKIMTSGENNTGVLVQSIGGKGGNGGSSSGFITYGSNGGSGGAGGTASATLKNNTSVETTGDHSSALLVQSIGGGGGNAGKDKGLVALGGDSGAGGDAGSASATLTDSTLKTQGDNADVSRHGAKRWWRRWEIGWRRRLRLCRGNRRSWRRWR